MKCYRMTYNSLQAATDRRLLHEAGLDVRGTVQYTNKDGDVRYLTFAEGSMNEGSVLNVTVLEFSL